MVRVCMATGFTQEQVAAILGVDHDTLVKHCKRELETGHLQIDAEMGGKLVKQCRAGNVTALIFYHKTRRGWRETSDVNHSGSIGVRHEDALNELD